jgi:hypothetical protein
MGRVTRSLLGEKVKTAAGVVVVGKTGCRALGWMLP